MPSRKARVWKYCFSSPSPHFNKLCFYFGRGWRRGLRNTATNDTDLSHRHDSCLTPCTDQSLPSPQHIWWCCPSWSHGVQKSHTVNGAEIASTFCPSKMQVYNDRQMEKWNSLLIWQQGSILLACSGFTSLQKDILGRLQGALHILFPWQVSKKDPNNSPNHMLKSHSCWKKNLYFQTVISQKVSILKDFRH